MALKGKHHCFTWNVGNKGSNFATPLMRNLMCRASKTVARKLGGPPLVLGSISRHGGGKMNPHKSHQVGRDVDILFYVLDPKGQAKKARGFYEFNDKGRCAHRRCRGWTFDLERNWWLVRTLVWSVKPYVQYAFVSEGLKKLLIDYASSNGEHPEIIKRAQAVLVQPRNSSPHADHFHVRIYCTADEKKKGCEDGGVRHRWVSR
jgi:penicillin-insensitive murein endopeptidase